MKKLFACVILVVMLASLSMTAFAAGQTASKEIDVNAKAVYTNPDNMYTAGIKGGGASITTKDGTVISITGNATELDGLTLNVIEVVKDDKEAYAWISGVMNGLGKSFTAYDIFLTDKDGNRVSVTGDVTVSITTPSGYTDVQVYNVSTDDKANKVSSKASGKNTVFTTNSFGYYVLADKTSAGGGTTDQTKPGDSDSAQTGDTSLMPIWGALLILSGSALIILGIVRKHRKSAK